MKFYNRQKEIAALREIETNSNEIAQMTVMVGRRRVGKTTLLKRAFENTSTLYFFVAKKNEVQASILKRSWSTAVFIATC